MSTQAYEISFLTFTPGHYPTHEMTQQAAGGGVVEYDQDGNEKPRWNCYRRLVFASSESDAETAYLAHMKESGITLPDEFEICTEDDVDHLYDEEENVAQLMPIGDAPAGLEW